jgi:hypothetical protein
MMRIAALSNGSIVNETIRVSALIQEVAHAIDIFHFEKATFPVDIWFQSAA